MFQSEGSESYHWHQTFTLQLLELNPKSLPLRYKAQPIHKSFPLATDNRNPVPTQQVIK